VVSLIHRRAGQLSRGALCCALLAACVQVSWERHELGTPLAAQADSELRVGEATFDQCLDQLGAPIEVWELSSATYAIAYGWDHQRDLGFSLSVPLADTGGSASVNFDDIVDKLHGVVFVFDRNDVLLRKRRGFLRDLAPDRTRRRSAFLDE
jgi:hypothetical protein